MNTNSDPTIIHETVLRDIVSLLSADIDSGLDKMAERMFGKTRNNFSYKNIAKVAKDLTLTFPVIVSDSVSVETASMLTKAIERKIVGMLQMLFSAIQVTNATNAIDYLRQFHTNLNRDSNMGVDDWIEIGNTLVSNEEFEQYANSTIDEMAELNPIEYIIDEDGRLEAAIKAVHDKFGIGYDKIRSMALKAIDKTKTIVDSSKTSISKTADSAKNTVSKASDKVKKNTSDAKKALDDAILAVAKSANASAKSIGERLDNAIKKVKGIPGEAKDIVDSAIKKVSVKTKLKEAYELADIHGITITDETLFEQAMTQFIEMGDFYLEETYSERSLNDYSINMNYGTVVEKAIVKEAAKPVLGIKEEDLVTEEEIQKYTITSFLNKENSLDAALNEAEGDGPSDEDIEKLRQALLKATGRNRVQAQQNFDAAIKARESLRQNDPKNVSLKTMKDVSSIIKANSDTMKNSVEALSKQIIPTDVQKANELVPTMMIINFVSTGDGANGERLTPIETQAVIGIKAKLQYVSATDMLDRLISKNEDKHGLFNFIKATTGQISFLKDFVFAIQKAKIDSIASSGKGSSSPIWKMLEHRALMSKLRRYTGSVNDAAAITTLVISQEEANYLKKYERMDITRVSVVNTIMNAYNIMGFVVVDETLEKANFLFDDGSGSYETVSFTHLERQGNGSDGAYKKVINLLTKRA